MKRPQKEEYAAYFQNYIDLVPEGEFFELFKMNLHETIEFFRSIDDLKHDYKYAEDKWTIKQVFMHLIDTERLFSFRAFVCSRLDSGMLLGSYDDTLYANNTDVSYRSMESLITEFIAVRNGALAIFENVNLNQSKFINDKSGIPTSARAMAYIMMGHNIHHFNVIRDRYL